MMERRPRESSESNFRVKLAQSIVNKVPMCQKVNVDLLCQTFHCSTPTAGSALSKVHQREGKTHNVSPNRQAVVHCIVVLTAHREYLALLTDENIPTIVLFRLLHTRQSCRHFTPTKEVSIWIWILTLPLLLLLLQLLLSQKFTSERARLITSRQIDKLSYIVSLY